MLRLCQGSPGQGGGCGERVQAHRHNMSKTVRLSLISLWGCAFDATQRPEHGGDAGVDGRGLHSSTFQLSLSRF
jgi:hypothetical protein